jgi:aminopeptidase
MQSQRQLGTQDFLRLLPGVFPPLTGDRVLGLLVDIPRDPRQDHRGWMDRRAMAESWASAIRSVRKKLGLEDVVLIAYPDVGSNNAELPGEGYLCPALPKTAAELPRSCEPQPFPKFFSDVQLFLAPTEYSATAPLKVAARQYGFRAATMPGFSKQMIPALKIDYNTVNRLVNTLKDHLDRARGAEVLFTVDKNREFALRFDLRWRKAHASGGRFPEKGTAGNLPSGEAYIVPYEGENRDKSFTEGILPVQISDSICLFTIKENRAVAVEGKGPSVRAEAKRLAEEPAYGNMAELGFGVLERFGITPVGSILLDEKLGFHVAFGRSEHFGGQVGPRDFSSPSAVIHLDRIYIPATQPRVRVRSITLDMGRGRRKPLMQEGRYLVFRDADDPSGS